MTIISKGLSKLGLLGLDGQAPLYGNIIDIYKRIYWVTSFITIPCNSSSIIFFQHLLLNRRWHIAIDKIITQFIIIIFL